MLLLLIKWKVSVKSIPELLWTKLKLLSALRFPPFWLKKGVACIAWTCTESLPQPWLSSSQSKKKYVYIIASSEFTDLLRWGIVLKSRKALHCGAGLGWWHFGCSGLLRANWVAHVHSRLVSLTICPTRYLCTLRVIVVFCNGFLRSDSRSLTVERVNLRLHDTICGLCPHASHGGILELSRGRMLAHVSFSRPSEKKSNSEVVVWEKKEKGCKFFRKYSVGPSLQNWPENSAACPITSK